jgi:hypothetical protein
MHQIHSLFQRRLLCQNLRFMIHSAIQSIMVLTVTMLISSDAHALISPGALAIVPPVQFPPQSFSVVFGRLSLLAGSHRDMYGVDIGAIGNKTENHFVGAAVSGIFNYNHGQATVIGLQFAGLANVNKNKAHIYGIQASLGVNMNEAESRLVGLEVSLANLSKFTDVYGVQIGLLNKAKHVYGFQIGLVNFAEDLHGIQIGLANFNARGLFSIAPLMNIGF